MVKLETLFTAILFADTERSVPAMTLTEKEFASVRASLSRKYSKWARDWAEAGDMTWASRYIKCSFDKSKHLATFRMADKPCANREFITQELV